MKASLVLGILKILDASDGQIDTRIRLQKEAFLLAAQRLPYFNLLDFEYHHYGPYSRSLSDALSFAVSTGLVEEVAHLAEDNLGSPIRYSYNLLEDGRKFLEDGGEDDHVLRDFVEFMRFKPWRSLELASTVRFLQLREGWNDYAAAFEEALRLKPATASYASQAQEVISKMESFSQAR
ncbi:hypothetical protein [Mangrovicella endophytica]|uniref:hypothetical protein n=1 Tax=Mangrovicella endophytica TaxID=2066697 RepID=UPI0012FFF6AA|nr:hypothetical protein [Mangrovicella endophytica]